MKSIKNNRDGKAAARDCNITSVEDEYDRAMLQAKREHDAKANAPTEPIALAQHTPGPWCFDKSPTGNGGVSHVVYDESGSALLIADVSWLRGGGEANARLIAAAPEMLEALRRVEADAITGEAPSGLALVPLEAFAALRAAIAKATGAKS